MTTEHAIEERLPVAMELLSQQGFVSVGELQEAMGVSLNTIRRDLKVLEDAGLIKRTHGGAVLLRDTARQKLAFADRETTALAEKQAIARAIAERIPENQTVILDGGTTCREVARALAGRHISVVTNSVPIASLLASHLDPEVTFVGGYVYPRTGVAVGPTAVEQLTQLHRVPRLVMSCAGVTPDRVFNINQMMVDVERGMMAAVEDVILAVDHTKFGVESLVEICPLGEIGLIVTDAGADRDTRAWLDSAAAEVVYAAIAETDRTEGSSWRP